MSQVSSTLAEPALLDPSGRASEAAFKNTPAGRKLMKATQEFEANLLASWWEEAEKGLKDPFEGNLGSGFDGLKGLAMNTMAMGMVQAGGIGIARMIFHSMEPALRRKLGEEGGSTAPANPSHTQNDL
jgi:hypothetical protein